MPVAESQRSLVVGALLGWFLKRAPSVERLPVGLLSPAEAATELRRVQARKAMDAAYEAKLVLALADGRPDADDPPPGHPGARRRGAGSPVPGTSEFLPDELAMVLNCSRSFAAGVSPTPTCWSSACGRCGRRALRDSWTGTGRGCSPMYWVRPPTT